MSTRITSRRRFWATSLAVASLLGFAAFAQLPQAKLNWIFPPGAQTGTTNEITFSGSDLDEPSGLQFSDPRVTATAKPGSPSLFQVIVPAEVTVDLVDVRFVGRFGASNPRAFAVSQHPELIAPATNTTSASALELPLETTANGRVTANTAAWFRFAAKARQRIFVRVEARELDSRLVPDLTVTDAEGRELALARRRQWLDFTAPTNGSYLLKLHDQTFRGGDDFHFRLTLTTTAQLDFALPNVLRAGETNRVTLFGRNLPGGQPGALPGVDGKLLEQLTVEIAAPDFAEGSPVPAELLRKPASAALAGDSFAWRLAATNGQSNPLLFTLTTKAVATSPIHGLVAVTPPCEVSGLFPARGQLSGVTFQANKGDVLWLELFSDRLGFPSDPHAVIQRERSPKGDRGETLHADVLELADADANLGDREFNTVTRDAAARFEAPETGTYRVLVRDLFNLGDGRPRYPYRLSLRREAPGFRLVALPMPPPRAGEDRSVHVLPVALRRDQTVALKVIAFRCDGFNGDIEMTATNLPPGVTAATTRIAAGQNTGTLLLTAAPDATGLDRAVLLGRATVGTNVLTHAAPLASVVWQIPDFNNEYATTRLDRGAVVSVVSAEWSPISVTPADAKPPEAVADGQFWIPLLITRRGEFQGAFNLKPAGHPALDKAKEVAVPAQATNVTAELNLAEARLPVGTHTLWFQGSVAGKYRNNPEALAAAELELQAAEKALASVSEKDKPMAEERKKMAEAAKKAAEERAKPRDVTVPVYSQPVVVTVRPEPNPEVKP